MPLAQTAVTAMPADGGGGSINWYRPGPEILQHLETTGDANDVPHDAAWTIYPEGQWVLGNHPGATAANMAELVALLFLTKRLLHHSLSEVPGYVDSPIDFPLVDQRKSVFARQRQYTDEEFRFGQNNLAEMLQQLELLFQHFIKVNLRAHPAETVLAASTIGYLGHLISATTCQHEEAKAAAIKSLQPPTSVKRLQAHLGLFNYYRSFVPGFSRIARRLYRLTAKGAAWEWTEECQQAYNQLKDALCTPDLASRQPDPNRPYHLSY